MLIIINKKKALSSLFIFLILIIILLAVQRFHQPHTATLVMGGILFTQNYNYQDVNTNGKNDNEDNSGKNEDENTIKTNEDVETYFRPSNLPVLNDRYIYSASRFLDQYSQSKISEIVLPKKLVESPEETIINYFSVLRDAANWEEEKNAGCGTIGMSKTPYPVAYHFLSDSYRKMLSYEQYLDSFKNILHTSLIKFKEVPVYINPSGIIRYFVEIETIGGSEKNVANFTYYYGFVDMVNEDNFFI